MPKDISPIPHIILHHAMEFLGAEQEIYLTNKWCQIYSLWHIACDIWLLMNVFSFVYFFRIQKQAMILMIMIQIPFQDMIQLMRTSKFADVRKPNIRENLQHAKV